MGTLPREGRTHGGGGRAVVGQLTVGEARSDLMLMGVCRGGESEVRGGGSLSWPAALKGKKRHTK